MQRHKPKRSGKPRPHPKPNNGQPSPSNKQKRPRPEYNKSKLAANDLEIRELQERYKEIDAQAIKKFAQFPLSKKTQKALAEAKFVNPTQVQLESLGPALLGKDVLGAAVTGSGKTLAFLIPVLEHLFIHKWSRTDGVGAIIISPTRELAYQIFETLKKVGKHHDFSAGLIIGGKNLKFERTRMDQCNILICTPGRLLQHMDENPLFNTSSMEVLVLDEADRCLDMGFQKTLNSIIENFPPERQTLLFSATQTNTVQDLARLNLKDPVYVGYGSQSAASTSLSASASTSIKEGIQTTAVLAVPELLQQSYVVLNLEDKITMLWSFIKNHLKQKIIVFVSSCKQAKYLYEIFCKLRPGCPLLALYGTLHQDRRIAIYEDFLRKSHVVMFSTDVASRGLDFPAVNWVVQLDCPEDVSQYIHRAGRSARNKTRGECLLVLTPSEEDYMIRALKEQLNLNIHCVQIDPKKLFSPRVKIEAFLAQFPELRATAQRAFLSYLKSVFLMRNKRLFNVFSLDLDAYAQSLGLAVTPRVPFLEKFLWRQKQLQQQQSSAEGPAGASQSPSTALPKITRQQTFGGEDSSNEDDDDTDDDDLIKVKRRDHDVEGGPLELQLDHTKDEGKPEEPLVVPKREKLVTKASLAKKALKKNLQVNSKLKFDEEGETVADDRSQMKALSSRQQRQQKDKNKDDDGGINLVLSKTLLSEEDQYDKLRFRELVKKRHKLQREKLRKKAEAAQETSEDEAEDEEGVNDQEDADANSDSDNSVDLSWLPDPDKVYKKESNQYNQNGDPQSQPKPEPSSSCDDNEDDGEDSDDEPAFKKSKLTNKMTLMDTEAIVANLLGS
ncbi:GL15986 [Drosophila persimilis]|uniref:ATP-dependent RNA helicase n=3 Tax=pseudoobscura subgroup TaxID=32358 RepID=B4H9X0_DROPE|nr:probable ATP-dependent RNA helicase DDX10 [Drosophila persimilis]EDW36627.1 GL15986 [Drosophila persimilis]